MSKLSLWKLYRDDVTIDSPSVKATLAEVPDEFHPIVKAFDDELKNDYRLLMQGGQLMCDTHRDIVTAIYGEDYTMKEFVAELPNTFSEQWDRSLVISLHKGKTPFRMLWAKLRPNVSES